MKQVEDLMAKIIAEQNETLHPDLVPYLEQSSEGWMMLRHPLVYQVPFFSNGSANAYYEQKRIAVEKATADKNYKQFVWLFERPYRVEAFIKIADKLSDTDLPITGDFLAMCGLIQRINTHTSMSGKSCWLQSALIVTT